MDWFGAVPHPIVFLSQIRMRAPVPLAARRPCGTHQAVRYSRLPCTMPCTSPSSLCLLGFMALCAMQLWSAFLACRQHWLAPFWVPAVVRPHRWAGGRAHARVHTHAHRCAPRCVWRGDCPHTLTATAAPASTLKQPRTQPHMAARTVCEGMWGRVLAHAWARRRDTWPAHSARTQRARPCGGHRCMRSCGMVGTSEAVCV